MGIRGQVVVFLVDKPARGGVMTAAKRIGNRRGEISILEEAARFLGIGRAEGGWRSRAEQMKGGGTEKRGDKEGAGRRMNKIWRRPCTMDQTMS
jgi:hypothetical protein